MLKLKYHKITLKFKQPAGTSRGYLTHKDSWLIILFDTSFPEKVGIGECSYIKDLSIDDLPKYEEKLYWLSQNINKNEITIRKNLKQFPSIIFGWEMAKKGIETKKFILYPSSFTKGKSGIPINGLIWMGDEHYVLNQIQDRIQENFDCLKMKISVKSFHEDIKVLKSIRKNFNKKQITIRVDANGAFNESNVENYLLQLSKLDIHSIEQPIAKNQRELMAELCKNAPIKIALDEELIGIFGKKKKEDLLTFIRPQYIIIKPSLLGGWKESEEWIKIANKLKIGWWITSALESNIGLNAIAQWTFTLNNPSHQGLGTGLLYENNINSPLLIKNGSLFYDLNKQWDKII